MGSYGVGAVSGPFVGFLWGFFGVWGGHLEGDLCGHGEAVGDEGLLVGRPPLPAVQFDAAAAAQQHLAVHLHRGAARQLTR